MTRRRIGAGGLGLRSEAAGRTSSLHGYKGTSRPVRMRPCSMPSRSPPRTCRMRPNWRRCCRPRPAMSTATAPLPGSSSARLIASRGGRFWADRRRWYACWSTTLKYGMCAPASGRIGCARIELNGARATNSAYLGVLEEGVTKITDLWRGLGYGRCWGKGNARDLRGPSSFVLLTLASIGFFCPQGGRNDVPELIEIGDRRCPP